MAVFPNALDSSILIGRESTVFYTFYSLTNQIACYEMTSAVCQKPIWRSTRKFCASDTFNGEL